MRNAKHFGVNRRRSTVAQTSADGPISTRHVSRFTFHAWLKATRPRTLSASVAPVLLGTALAAAEVFHPLRLMLALAGSVAIQAGTNMLNEHFDHVQGLDQTRERRADMVVQTGEMAHGALLRGGLAAMLLGSLCGLVLVALTGPALLVAGVLSVLAGIAYTAKPLAFGYRALGEVTVFAFMGPVMVMGAAYVQTETWTWQAFLLSVPAGFLVTAILHVNNIRDMTDDRANGKRTLANLLGRRAATYEYWLLVPGSYAVLAMLVLTKVVAWPALLALVTLPAALRLAGVVADERQAGRALDLLMVRTAKLHLRFCVLVAAGLVAAALI